MYDDIEEWPRIPFSQLNQWILNQWILNQGMQINQRSLRATMNPSGS
jgi:hypothetical protein